MGIVLDVILIAVIILFVVLSAKKGVIITLLEVVAFVAAVILASQLAQPVASGMYKAFFQKSVQKELYELLPENPSGLTYSQKAQYVIDSMPDFAKNYAEKVGIDVSSVSEKLQRSNYANNDELYETLEENVVKPVATAVLKNIMFYVLSIAFALILRLVAGYIAKLLKKTSIFGSADKIVGGVLGILKGVVVVFLLCCLLTYLEPKLSNDSVKQAIDDSTMVELCEDLDPMEAISAANVLYN